MSRSVRSLFAFLFLCTALSSSAATDPTYTALRAVRPDAKSLTLNNFTFDRDVFHVTLNGTLVPLQQVEGKTPGAIFIGTGTYELKPATLAERKQLSLYAGDDKLTSLSDTFDSAIFLGTALVSAAVKSGAPAGGANASANDKWDDYLKKQKKTFRDNMHLRMLQEILNAESDPLFFVWVNGKKYPPAILKVDARDKEPVSMVVLHDQKGGLWYSSVLKTPTPMRKPLVDPDNYVIDSTIKGAEISATSTITFTAIAPVRVLPLNLFGNLRISDASWSPAGDAPAWEPVAYIQEDKDEDYDAAIVFPKALEAGKQYLLKMTYAGKDVLTNAGDGNFSVGARLSWYPNVAVFDDLANYELRFRVPQKMQVVAIGNQVEDKVEGDQRVSVWKSETPVRVAGFNYGKFKKLSQVDKDSGMSIEVYTNPGTPDVVRLINQYLEANAEEEGGPSSINVDTGRLSQSALADGINTARTGNHYFGPLAHKHVSITQQSEWNFGQSWPSLIYIPYLAFLNGTQRMTLGLTGAKDFVDNVGAHEFGHQWWGHQIGFATYRDQWLSEGFAEFTASLVAQQTGGWASYNKFWENARKSILNKGRGATMSNDQAGPITQGFRLATWQTPEAYDAIVYSKGAYVLHMLRMAMWEPKNADAAFVEMMRDFAATYAGKNPTTLDFQRMVEKHATKSLKLTADGKLDWFFGQWVDGTAIPKFDSKIDFQDVGGGKYKLTGSVTQSGVPDNFATIVPIYVYFDKTNYVRLGASVMVGNSTKPIEGEIGLPKKPLKFVINVNHDVLAR
jgi:peptidase M1-like protein